MLLRVCLLVATFSTPSYCFRSQRNSRSAVWQLGPEHDEDKEGHDVAWADWHDGHDSGYVMKKDGHHEKDQHGFKHAVKEEAEQHALKSAAGAGKHSAVAAEKGLSKHADQASALGKDIKAKTFGFFDYQYKQPEYHVEQFYTDEKQRRKFGADRLHHALKDHESDSQEASGWGKHGKGYHNDAHGIDAHEHGGKAHDDWGNDFHKAYGHAGEKDYFKGHEAHKGHHHQDYLPEHHHYGHYDGWFVPHHGYGYGHAPGWWGHSGGHDEWGHGWEHGWD